MKRRFHPLKKAFSLTEVTIALGIIGFCALAVMGLLPVAVQSHRRGHDQTQAAQILGNFLVGFQAPIAPDTNQPTVFSLPYPYNGQSGGISPSGVKWTNGSDMPTLLTFSNIGADGNNTNANNPARYVLSYQIRSPDVSGYGNSVYATISWPPTTNAKGVQGTLQGMVYFNSPRRQ